ncbi:RagB/SusD family nutrient uptake outer membrane protein [Limibacter armeniacum]|uniref:RagB/SusD family nutrient uptake outer membrane protein n=1 Tax=Limibacter armeniacum TaxID=466084 RepID=UPI002FE62DB3
MKIKHIAIATLLLFSMGSCTNLDEEPVGVLAPESVFNTTGDIESAIFGAYGLLAHENIYGRKLTLTLQVRSDMSDIGDRGTPARRIQINDFNLDGNNGMVTAFWPALYSVIGAANAAIEGTKQVEADEKELLELEAEARFVKAFAYYHLVRLFGDIPYVAEFVKDPEALSTISKTKEAEVYQHIVDDLLFAKEHGVDKHENEVRSRATAGSAATMLASVYLTMGEYDKAAEEAKWVISNAGKFGYSLENDFQDLFRAEIADQLKEPIFTIDFLAQQYAGSSNDDLMGPVTGIRGSEQNGWGVSVPSMKVYETWDDNDYRKQVSFFDEVMVNGVLTSYPDFPNEKRPHIAKFTRFSGNAENNNRRSDNNYMAFRYAEVLLMAAEAINEVNGPTAEAIGYVNQVRERARNAAGVMNTFPVDISGSFTQDEFRELVLDERRLELAFEFKRWYDIKRRNLLEKVFTGPDALEPHENVSASRDYHFPLPQDELQRNPNLLPQNSGY